MKISKRHLAKTISWRIIGTLDTLVLSWIISGDILVGVSIGTIELFSKMILYYLHERVWFRSKIDQSNKRHVLKTFSWRAIGTTDTILIAWIISGEQMIGIKVGIAEIATKMILYYFHERLWYKINYGLNLKNNRNHSAENLNN